jgi:hypothetical protein
MKAFGAGSPPAGPNRPPTEDFGAAALVVYTTQRSSRDTARSPALSRRGVSLLDLGEEVAQVVGYRPLGEPEGEHGGEQSALEAPEVANCDYLYPAAATCRRRPDLPRAPGLEDVRVSDEPLDRSRL